MEDVNNKNMKKLKLSDWIVMGGLLVLLLLVIFQLVTHNHFRNDAGKWAQPSIDNKNIIKASGISMAGNTLIVDLSGQSQLINAKHLPADQILEKQNFKILHDHKGNIVLVSDDPSESARIWMLLSQMGIKDLYILTEN